MSEYTERLVTNPVRHFFDLDTNDPLASLCGRLGPGDLVREVEANVNCGDCLRELRVRQERCPVCGQADNCGDCNHAPAEVAP